MNIVRINARSKCLCSISGQTYNESIYISEELYQQINAELDELELFIRDSDGKYSETKCNISIDIFPKDTTFLLTLNYSNELYLKIYDICYDKGIDLAKDIDKIHNYLTKNDLILREYSFTIKPSQYTKLLKYVKTLNKSNSQQL